MNFEITNVKRETDYTIFLKNLHAKICSDCGCHIVEQQESFFTKCDHCLSKEIE